MQKENLILDKSFSFALAVLDLYVQCQNRKEYVLSKQFLRSGTSIGANVEESVAAHSKKDFVNKLKIANKEARETRYWFRLLQHSKLVDVDFQIALLEIESIINILTKIIKTTEQNTPE